MTLKSTEPAVGGAHGAGLESLEQRLREAEARFAFLRGASASLTGSVDLGDTHSRTLRLSDILSRIVRLSVPFLGDWCEIHMIDDDAQLRARAFAHSDPAKEPLLRELVEAYPFEADDQAGVPRAIRAGEPAVYHFSAEGAEAFARDERHRELLRALAPVAAMVVPLLGGGRAFGALLFIATDPARRFAPEDVALAEELAHRASLAVENARLLSETKHAERQLRRQLDFTTAMSESLGEGVFALDCDGNFIFVNPAAERLVGWSEAELIGRSLAEVLAPERVASIVAAICVPVPPGSPLAPAESQEDTFRTKDGSPVMVAFTATVLSVDRQIMGSVVAFHDIGERKAVERALRDEETRYRSLFESSRDGIMVQSASRIVYVNPAFVRMFGYDEASELVGDTVVAVIAPEDRARLLEYGRRRSLGEEAPTLYEAVGQRRDGSPIDVELAVSSYAVGEEVYLVSLCRDIGGRKRAERELRMRARQQAVVARLGQHALGGTDFAMLIQEAASMVAEILEAEFCQVWELAADGDKMFLRAGVGFDFELLRSTAISRGTGSLAGYVMASGTPVVVADLAGETRFERSPQVDDVQAVSAAGVVIHGNSRPFGVLSVETRARREFDKDDVNFLQAVGNIIATVSDRERADEALSLQTSFFRQLFENSPEGIAITDTSDAILDANQGFEKLFGYAADDIRGRNLNALIAPEDLQEEAWALSRTACGGSIVQRESVRRRRDGRAVDVSILGYPIVFGKRQIGVFAIYGDITERRRAEETIRHQAYHDGLTGLPNRLLFNDRLTVALAHARRHKQMLAVLFLDLDRFKFINDTLGHAVGDELLRSVSARLAELVREEDTVARGGGDEFIVLLSQIERAKDAAGIAQKILETLHPPFTVDDRELHVTASIGISLYPYDGEDAQSLLKNADTAMYRAKDQGRNNYRFYTPGMNAKAFERLALENNLRHALRRNEFVLYYQPQTDIASGRMIAAEALVRWQHPDFGLIYPGEFIPLAEETGLIVPLGEWVLRTACKQCKDWIDAGLPPLRVAVNLSARQLQQPDLIDVVAQILEETGLDPSFLELEITESVAMQNADLTIVVLHGLREMGIQISMDDFGTGYSSLSYLKKFPLNTLKIDQSFIRDLTVDPSASAIAAAVIALGHGLHLKVIAEGVETEEELAILRDLDCDAVQGYLYSRPVSNQALEKLLVA